jgi:hypothetical protein
VDESRTSVPGLTVVMPGRCGATGQDGWGSRFAFVGPARRAAEDHGVSARMLESGVSDYEYRQRVRRYKPSSLVPLIAAAAARYWQQQDWLNTPYRKVHAMGAGGRGPRLPGLRH